MKKKLAVLFGGYSPEYTVSLQSAFAVLTHIDHSKYQVIPIGITKEGKWLRYSGKYKNIVDDLWFVDAKNCTEVFINPSRNHSVLIELYEGNVSVLDIDAVFPVLHGKNGEDGTVQGMFELAGTPVIGCGTESSAVCMDKYRAHMLASSVGIKTPVSVTVSNRTSAESLKKETKHMKYPLFVKPLRAGSSFGISKVDEKADLYKAVLFALQHDDEAVIEEEIKGFEVGCAVLEGEELITGRVDEIELADGFFDFTEKYTLKSSKIHMPARIEAYTEKRIQNTAKRIYTILGCSGFARVDMFLTPDWDIVFHEVNTIPGFTSHSRYPNMLKGVGISFEQLVDTLIGSCIK